MKLSRLLSTGVFLLFIMSFALAGCGSQSGGIEKETITTKKEIKNNNTNTNNHTNTTETKNTASTATQKKYKLEEPQSSKIKRKVIDNTVLLKVDDKDWKVKKDGKDWILTPHGKPRKESPETIVVMIDPKFDADNYLLPFESIAGVDFFAKVNPSYHYKLVQGSEEQRDFFVHGVKAAIKQEGEVYIRTFYQNKKKIEVLYVSHTNLTQDQREKWEKLISQAKAIN
jgi:hypothetical protein